MLVVSLIEDKDAADVRTADPVDESTTDVDVEVSLNAASTSVTLATWEVVVTAMKGAGAAVVSMTVPEDESATDVEV